LKQRRFSYTNLSVCITLVGFLWSCLPYQNRSALSDDRSTDGEAELYALLDSAEADLLLNYDFDGESFDDAIEVPSISDQARSGYDPKSYWGQQAYELLEEYRALLSDEPEFADLRDDLLGVGRVAAQLLAAERAYNENAVSISTNLPLGKGSEHWLGEAQKAQNEFQRLKRQYSAEGLDKIIVLGFSRFSVEARQMIRGGTGFDAAMAAAEAEDLSWGDGLQSLGAGPIEFLLGAGILKGAFASLTRASARMVTVGATRGISRFVAGGSIRSGVQSAARNTRTLIDTLIRRCTGFGLVAKGSCANHVVSHANGGFKHGWIKRDLFQQLRGLAGPENTKKFIESMGKGVVGPTGRAGIKQIKGPLYELKINGSAMRLLGMQNKNGTFVFTRFEREGLHVTGKANDIIAAMLRAAQ
jgi:hypothetical protein